MKVKFHLRLCLFLYVSLIANGDPDLPYFYEVPLCSNGIVEEDAVPFYEFDKPLPPFDKRSDYSEYLSDISTPTSICSAGKWDDFIPKNRDMEYLTFLTSPQTIFNPTISRMKRSVFQEKDRVEDAIHEHQQYGIEIPSPFFRQTRKQDNVKTIHVPSSFTPRLGRKRSSEDVEDLRDNDNFQMGGINGRSHVINLSAGNAFTPRLGRSEGATRIHLNAGSAFTPRLGRSEDSNRIQLNAGSAFTPRLGRSEDSNRIQLNAGSAFTPRLGRSDDSNRIQLNAGSAFTPRLGRSENPNHIHLNAGSAFTPRLGRSGVPNRIHLNAGGGFTPRFGRSDNLNRVQLNAGSAFTPRLGRSEGSQKIRFNAGNAFTPRLGRSENLD